MKVESDDKYKKEKEFLRKAITSGDLIFEGRFRKFFKNLPSEPRCKFCNAPFQGVGGAFVRLVFKKSASNYNPHFCTTCFDIMKKTQYGTEGKVTFLFADIRGSTSLAEGMSNEEYSQLLNRFYKVTIQVLVRSDAIIDKMIGDEVMALYLPGFAGIGHVRKAIEAAKEILQVTGHDKKDKAWISVGVGVHTGDAYIGTVGSQEGVVDITALGDNVNIAARLTSLAKEGEILVSEIAATQANLDVTGLERRRLEIKGKSQAMFAWVLKADTK